MAAAVALQEERIYCGREAAPRGAGRPLRAGNPATAPLPDQALMRSSAQPAAWHQLADPVGGALVSLDGQDSQPAAEPAGPSPALPDYPGCRQILTAFAALRARDLCVALDLPIASGYAENIRSELKRLVSAASSSGPNPG